MMAQVLALSGERDQWTTRLITDGQAAYETGYADALADRAHDADGAWADAPVLLVRNDSNLDELEELRWGPGGRERFGDPRPGDFMGGAL